MKKPIVVLALVAAAGFAFGACGGDEPKPKDPTTAKGSGTGTEPTATSTEPPSSTGPTENVTGDAKSDYDKGFAAWQNGDLQQAKDAFTKATKADPKNPSPHYALACVLERLGDNAGAQGEFRAAFNAKPDHEPSLCGYAYNVAMSGHISEADLFLTEKVAKSPSSPGLKTCLAEVKSRAKDSAGAQQLAQDALRLDPDYKPAMVVIARDHQRAGRADLARYALTAILDGFGLAAPARDKDNPEAHLIRGIMRRDAGQRIGAMEDFQVARAKRPDLVEATIQIGAMKLEAGNATEAQPLLESSVKFAPKNALAHLNLGDCYRLLGRVADAKKELDVAMSLDSSLPQTHYALGLLYLFAPQYPGMSETDKLGAAIKELNTYKTMRGPKAPPGVQDDVEELIARAQQKQKEIADSKAAASAVATTSAKPAASSSAKPDGGK
jgi:Tfp pilus assembly protein PilF